MIDFKEITLDDRETITAISLRSGRRNCDLSFSNLCSWRFLYDTRYAIIDGMLVFKFWADGQLAYMMPLGEGDVRCVVEKLINDAHENRQRFCMLGISSFMKEDLESIMPGTFDFNGDRDYADYIYLRSDLSTLKGKRFQAKRNHVNKFRKLYPDYVYTPLTREHVESCLKLEAEWFAQSDSAQHEGTGNERRALTYALQHLDELGLMGGVLYVNGDIAAFTFGSPISQEFFDVHVEKADTRIEGAYAMINYEFANRIPEQYTYINREEDLGLEGLRRAKLSYQPVIILEKFMACLKEEHIDFIKW
jgi:hypothetical protein